MDSMDTVNMAESYSRVATCFYLVYDDKVTGPGDI